MYHQFKIGQPDSLTDIEISNGHQRYQFSASKVYPHSFSEILQGIIESWKGSSEALMATFDREADSPMYMLFINYPRQLLKIELYTGIDWDNHGDYFENLPVPVPVFSMLTTHYHFARLAVKAIASFSRDDFYCWDTGFFDKELPELKKMAGL